MEKANSAGAESDSRTSGMPQNKTHKVCVIPLVVGQQMVKLQIRGWKDGDPRYATAKHSKLSPIITWDADQVPTEYGLEEMVGKSQNVTMCWVLLHAFYKA